MNHRERILAAVHHEPLDRLPTDMWAIPEVQEQLCEHFGITTAAGEKAVGIKLLGGALARDVSAILELWNRLDIDGILSLAPPYIGPARRQEGDLRFNEWGMGFREQSYRSGTYAEQIVYPLASCQTIGDLDAYTWPDPAWYDYSALPALAARCGGRAICCGYVAPLTYHGLLRGLEVSLTDPLLHAEFTHHLLERLSAFNTEYCRRCFEALRGLVDFTQVTDDYGMQGGLIFSPRTFDRFYRAPVQRAIDLAKSHGLAVFHHDDGDMRTLLPTLVEMGIDILNPLQWRCGDWDLAALKADYRQRLCFHGAVDSQRTLPFGTPEEVRAEVRHLVETLAGDGRGFIIGPCHNLQADTPVKNILALYQTAHDYGEQWVKTR